MSFINSGNRRRCADWWHACLLLSALQSKEVALLFLVKHCVVEYSEGYEFLDESPFSGTVKEKCRRSSRRYVGTSHTRRMQLCPDLTPEPEHRWHWHIGFSVPANAIISRQYWLRCTQIAVQRVKRRLEATTGSVRRVCMRARQWEQKGLKNARSQSRGSTPYRGRDTWFPGLLDAARQAFITLLPHTQIFPVPTTFSAAAGLVERYVNRKRQQAKHGLLWSHKEKNH